MVQRDPNAEPSEMNHREPVVCPRCGLPAHAGSPRRQSNASGTRFGTTSGLFYAQPCTLASICSHFAKAASAREIEKPYISQG
jgi:hypothetical protein